MLNNFAYDLIIPVVYSNGCLSECRNPVEAGNKSSGLNEFNISQLVCRSIISLVS